MYLKSFENSPFTNILVSSSDAKRLRNFDIVHQLLSKNQINFLLKNDFPNFNNSVISKINASYMHLKNFRISDESKNQLIY